MDIWTTIWSIIGAVVTFLVLVGIYISLVTQYRQSEPKEKYWKSLYHIHNPPEEDSSEEEK